MHALSLDRETGLYLGSFGNNLNESIKNKYIDILNHYNVKQHFYAQQINKLETLIKSKETELQR